MITSSVFTWNFYETKIITAVQKINPNFIQKIVLKQIKYPLILRIIYNSKVINVIIINTKSSIYNVIIIITPFSSIRTENVLPMFIAHDLFMYAYVFVH